MNKERSTFERIRWGKQESLSFLLPLLAMLGIFATKAVFPFGKESFLRTDLYHQYAPFFQEFQRKLQSGESLFYSFNLGLGSNFIALIAYYLASPLNCFILFFPKGLVIEFVSYLVLLKIALAGATASLYFRYHFQKNSPYFIVFAFLYAMSGYIAAYSWNVMWLDCVFLFPLILLGLERLMDRGKVLLYTVSLALAILSNYYISIMICLFLVIYFLFQIFFCFKERRKDIFLLIFRFGIYSLLAGAMAAVFLLPAYFALRFTASSSISFPKSFNQYFGIIDMLARQFAFVETEQGLKHWPNIYAGSLILFLLPLYYRNQSISLSRKCFYGILSIFFFLSFSINVLNFIWHGFHYPNSLPARQSFLYIFLLLTQGAELMVKRKGNTKKDYSLSFFLCFAFALLCQKVITVEGFHWSVFYLGMLFSFLYYLLFVLEKKAFSPRTFFYTLLAITFIEATANMAVTSVPTTNRANYLEGQKETAALLSVVKVEDEGFYRVDKADRKTKDDGALMQYPSASIFSSTAYGKMSEIYTLLGMEASTNAYAINGATPFLKSLLSIKYLITKEEISKAEEQGLAYWEGEGDYRLYENTYALPLGFALSEEELSQWNEKAGTPALVQNSISEALTQENILETILGEREGENYSFTAKEEGHYFAYVNNTKVEEVKVQFPEKEKSYDHVDRGYLLDLGYLSADSEVQLSAKTEGQSMDTTVYRFHYDVLSDFVEALSGRGFKLDKKGARKIEGEIQAKEEGKVFFSLPYDPGWKVTVDGEKVEAEELFTGFLGIPISQGAHSIRLQYTPEGWNFGLLLSISAILFFALLLFLRKRLALENAGVYTASEENLAEKSSEQRLKAHVSHSIRAGRSRKRGHSPYPVKVYTGRLPRGRKRGLEVEKMDVKE